jgi:manganese/iron transport system permease protein
MSFSELLLDPLQLTFMQYALVAAVLVGTISGIVGAFVVVRGMSFFGDALAHTVLPGVAVAYVYGGGGTSIPVLAWLFGSIQDDSLRLFIGGLLAGVIAALGIGWLTRNERLKEDTAIGIIFVAMFALGIAIISSDPRAYGQNDLTHILFGDILGITRTDLYIMAGSGLFVAAVIGLLYKELVLVSFDRGLATSMRLPTEGLRLLLLVLMAVTIVASLQTVGVALMLAMLITPAATAQLITRRIHHMILVSALVGAVGGIIGIYLSWHLEIATGPAIVLAITTIFGLTFAVVHLRRH